MYVEGSRVFAAGISVCMSFQAARTQEVCNTKKLHVLVSTGWSKLFSGDSEKKKKKKKQLRPFTSALQFS